MTEGQLMRSTNHVISRDKIRPLRPRESGHNSGTVCVEGE